MANKEPGENDNIFVLDKSSKEADEFKEATEIGEPITYNNITYSVYKIKNINKLDDILNMGHIVNYQSFKVNNMPIIGEPSTSTLITSEPPSVSTSVPTSGPTSEPISGLTSEPTSVPTSGPTLGPTSGSKKSRTRRSGPTSGSKKSRTRRSGRSGKIKKSIAQGGRKKNNKNKRSTKMIRTSRNKWTKRSV